MKRALHISREWLPYRIDSNGTVHWCWFGEQRLSEPFFRDTLMQRMRLPFNMVFAPETPVDTLLELHSSDPGLEPAALIFHMSRCGSTLVGQMLGALDDAIVLSESPCFDDVFKQSLPREETVALLRAAVSASARPRFGEKRLFIKFDSWLTRDLPLIREAFPNAPWIFLYRDPVEVLVSHMRASGSQMIPGNMVSLVPELDVATAVAMGRERYYARVLAEFCRNALPAAGDPMGMFLNYTELPDAVTGKIAEHFHLDLTAAEREAMTAASRRNAKAPSQTFTSDRSEKQAEATDAVRSAADEFLSDLYAQLQKL